MIGEKTFVKGTIKAKENLVILGRVEGTIDSTGGVIVGESGIVEAGISGDTVMVSGTVQGTVRTASLFCLHRSGTLSGEVKSPRIQIEEGSIFQGRIDMTK
jgi:cytoskeletal protein CcmA (bactofilin family)